ncbi:MAG: hypothetical protein SPL72_02855, partial [Cyanobacteriota bacterium]|nr:hypothetical protein [Cyanobacteriota bacterium]
EKNNGADSFLPDMGRSGGVLTSQNQTKANGRFANLKTKIGIFFAKMNGEPLPNITMTSKVASVQKL